MKKFLTIGLAIVFMISIVACGSNKEANKSPSSSPSQTASNEPNPTEASQPPASEGTVDFPKKEVKMIIPAAAGGTLDLAPRALAQAFQEISGQPLVAENIPGGAQVTGTAKMTSSSPDGYTIAVVPSGVLSLRPALQKVEYQFPDDFTPIIGIGDFQIVFAVPASAPYNTMTEMATYYKEKGGEPRFSTSGVNTYSHVLSAMVSKETGMKLRHLPFDGNAGAVTAILGGNAEVAVVNLSNVAAQLESGDVKIIAVPSAERYGNYDQAPTLKEQGINVVGGATFAIYGPAGMDPQIQKRLTDIFSEAMESEQFKQFAQNTNLFVTKQSPEEVANAIIADFDNIVKIKEELQ